jgi:hypothetical protein
VKQTRSENQKLLREIFKALDRMPAIVAQKKRRALARRKFLKSSFGPLVRQLTRELAKKRPH